LLNEDSGVAHMLERAVTVSRLSVDRASRVGDDMDFVSKISRVDRRFLHAVIQRQTRNPQSADAVALELIIESGLAKCRITVAIGMSSFTNDDCVRRQPQVGVKLGALRPLNAMRRPGSAAFLEADVMGWMPVAARNHMRAATYGGLNPAIDQRNDRIAFRNA